MNDHLTRLRETRERALAGGGPERVADQKAKGKGTARERLSYLLSFFAVQSGPVMNIEQTFSTTTGEDVTARDLGGSVVHNSRSGVAQLMAESEGRALELVKLLLGAG